MTSKPAQPEIGPQAAGQPAAPAWVAVSDGEARTAMLGYLGAIVTGPLIPLGVYAVAKGRSRYLRAHAAMAVNLSATWLLYLVCCAILCGLLALDSLTVAVVVASAIAAYFWSSMVRYLIRGYLAARRGEPFSVPAWLCAQIVKL